MGEMIARIVQNINSYFSDDAQERIRGKCPLELAGYEVRKLPIAQPRRGWTLWPVSAFQELVPNV